MTDQILHIAFLSAKNWDYGTKKMDCGVDERRLGVRDYTFKEETYTCSDDSGKVKTCLLMNEHLLPDISAKEWDNALRSAFETAINTRFVQVDLVSIQLENAKATTAGRLPCQFEN